MGKRFVSALLSIMISLLKFIVNMLTIGISFLTKKSLPLVDDLFDSKDERQEAIERSKYVVEHSPYDSPH
jgi:hypothetical protein